MSRLDLRLGEFVKVEGNEQRYRCLICGTKGLLLGDKGWYCFGCGEGGSPKGDFVPTQTEGVKERPGWDSLLKQVIPGFKYEAVKPTQTRYISEDILSVATNAYYGSNGVYYCFPLRFSDGSVAGVTVWGPVGRSYVTYRTAGARGFYYYHPRKNNDPQNIFLFEGIFDLLAIAEIEFDQGNLLICSMGNTLSKTQEESLYILLQEKYPTAQLHICFDNDKIHAPLQLASYVKVFSRRPIKLVLPSEAHGKDWHDAFSRSTPAAFKRDFMYSVFNGYTV